MSEEMVKKIKAFVEDWRTTAKLDDVELCDIQVNLVMVLEDICAMTDLNPELIGLSQMETA